MPGRKLRYFFGKNFHIIFTKKEKKKKGNTYFLSYINYRSIAFRSDSLGAGSVKIESFCKECA